MLHAQEYLDAEHKYMKLSESSQDSTYGLRESNPILLGSRVSMGHFLNGIVPLNGDRLQIMGLKELSEHRVNLLRITLRYQSHPDSVVLYFLFGELRDPKAPKGFRPKTTADLPAGTKLADEASDVKPCGQTIYATDVHELNDQMPGAQRPQNAPSFEGGEAWLLGWFGNHPLNLGPDCANGQMHFQFAVTINCKGYGGNYELIGEADLHQRLCGLQLLDACRTIPQHWKSAMQNGQPVDCKMQIDLELSEGKVTVVRLR